VSSPTEPNARLIAAAKCLSVLAASPV